MNVSEMPINLSVYIIRYAVSQYTIYSVLLTPSLRCLLVLLVVVNVLYVAQFNAVSSLLVSINITNHHHHHHHHHTTQGPTDIGLVCYRCYSPYVSQLSV